ncbi:radical SAM protein [Rhodobacteraceae bacterium NNCM2]|nr:radical SAM protein [Coraliihabitans acroporae]
MNKQSAIGLGNAGIAKFSDPLVTAGGERRASVALQGLQTLWFNTGTLCNIECENCYILSSPTNDALVYLSRAEVEAYLDEISQLDTPTGEIGFTGGEPFMNPEIIQILEASLKRGFRVLVLTNAMRPMMRRSMQAGLKRLESAYPGQLTLRVSLDHFGRELHDAERGKGSYDITLTGMRWLRDLGIRMDVAGRTLWGETEADSRRGFQTLFDNEGFDIDASDPARCVLFPEMDETADVPEITTACWGILGKRPEDVMCASSRMVVKRRGEDRPVVLACTLLAYDRQFEMGRTLAEASRPVALNHPHCAKFCVLGGASCSG